MSTQTLYKLVRSMLSIWRLVKKMLEKILIRTSIILQLYLMLDTVGTIVSVCNLFTTILSQVILPLVGHASSPQSQRTFLY